MMAAMTDRLPWR